MKYKVGDKVRVRSDLEVNKLYGDEFTVAGMEDLKGQIVTIKKITTFDNYKVNEDMAGLNWTDEMLLPVTFTKSDLKTGHVVEYRNGQRRLVVGNALIDNKGNEANELTDATYKNDLTDIDDDKLFDIIKVYEINPNFTGDLCDVLYNDSNLILIWEREEPPKKMTVAEIEAALGHRVEVVSEVEQ